MIIQMVITTGSAIVPWMSHSMQRFSGGRIDRMSSISAGASLLFHSLAAHGVDL